jgi:SecD/SecF fusion protein
VSSDLISQALILILVGSLGILLWITYRFRDVKFGVTALVSLLHDVIVVVGRSRSSARSSTSRSTRCS